MPEVVLTTSTSGAETTWVMGAKFFTKLTFMDFIPKKQFDFLGQARPWITGSLILVGISIVAVGIMDPRGVELKGGDSLTIRTENKSVTTENIIASIEKLDLGAELPFGLHDRVAPDGGVPLHDREFLRREATGLQEDVVRDADLADVVQRR